MQKIYSLEIGSRDKEQGRLLFRSLDGGCGRPIWSHPPPCYFFPCTDIVTNQPSIESALLGLFW